MRSISKVAMEEKMNSDIDINKLKGIIEHRGRIRKVGVIGMGYVGIPAAALFADSGATGPAVGFQRDSHTSGYKIDMLNRGDSPLKGEEPGTGRPDQESRRPGKFKCTSDFSKISELDAVTLSIQTPFKDPKDLVPDFGALIDGLKRLAGTSRRALSSYSSRP